MESTTFQKSLEKSGFSGPFTFEAKTTKSQI